ncbi:hypothetical protein FGRMN_8461 [Fusarium graminum]|nr:hypothetical protein FGRMN_8461 [Fusarium graminum]
MPKERYVLYIPSTQERPYVSRPSRSQQLRNPKLVPKLTNDTLNPLEKKKGVADEELAKAENERAHQSPHTRSLLFQRALPGLRHPARAEHNPLFMSNEAEALFPTAHEVVVKMTAEAGVANLAQIGAEALVSKHDAEDLYLPAVDPLEITTGVISIDLVTLCHLTRTRLGDSQRGTRPTSEIQMDLNASATTIQDRPNEGDTMRGQISLTFGTIMKDCRLKGDSLAMRVEVDVEIPKSQHGIEV